ncbi:MAG: 2,3-bisphosphoglycerate-independent phosphoglycerate mutase [Pseudomonadota bacterium]
MNKKHTVILCILDGWGHSDNSQYNAIMQANTPVWDKINQQYPKSLLATSGLDVGLPNGQMGNSEVGHMNIGSGRIVMQDLPRINAAIAGDMLKDNPKLNKLIKNLQDNNKNCHLMGLLSPGGVHSHQDHLLYMAKLVASQNISVKLHLFTDGRDVEPKSALKYVKSVEKFISENKLEHLIQIASIAGRYYAMDRDNRWERIEQAYDVITAPSNSQYNDAIALVEHSYQHDIYDEFIVPASVSNYQGAEDGDGLIMINFRADRVRQILNSLILDDFTGFTRKNYVKWSTKIGMVDYSEQLSENLLTIFQSEDLDDVMAEVIAKNNMAQLHISETEKYAHVTFFFNGGKEQNFVNEDRILIKSPDVATYDLQPEMSSEELTEALCEAIESDKYHFIVVNYPNADMVGHTGNHAASIKAIEAIDKSLGRIMESVEKMSANLFITADHGNAELMFDDNNNIAHTSHTTNKVPFIACCHDNGNVSDVKDGKLSDIAPTLLDFMNINIPAAMTGNSLIIKANS